MRHLFLRDGYRRGCSFVLLTKQRLGRGAICTPPSRLVTTDTLGNVTTFEYNSMNGLTKVTLHRVDGQNGVDEYEVTLYEYDGRGLQTKVVDALGNVTVHEYDGNGNLVKTTDPDGYVTGYTYDSLDLVSHINYNGGKQVDYAYNKTGDLVEMTD